MHALRPVLFLVLAAVLTGCFQTKAVIRLNADGSGTVEETVLMNSMMSMGLMEELMKLGAELDPDIDVNESPEMAEDGPYSVQALRERAAEMGATFQSAEGADILFGSGYTAVYAFEDINSLRLSTNTFGDALGQFGGAEEVEEDPVTFSYVRGELTVRMPERREEGGAWEDDYDIIGDGEIIDEPYMDGAPVGDMEDVIGDGEIIDEIELDFDNMPPPRPGMEHSDPKKSPSYDSDEYALDDYDTGSDEDEMRAMAAMFKDMHMTIEIVLPSDVRETTAQYLDGRTLTLVDLDFGALAQNPEASEQLDAMEDMMTGPPSFGVSGMGMFENIPGFRFETAREITVSF